MTRYEWVRKRIAPVALIAALGAIGARECEHQRTASETIELRLGPHASEVQHLRADVFVGDQPVAHAERDLTRDASSPVRFPAVIEGERARILIDLATTQGPKRIERALTPGDVVIVDLSPDL